MSRPMQNAPWGTSHGQTHRHGMGLRPEREVSESERATQAHDDDSARAAAESRAAPRKPRFCPESVD